MSFFLTRKNYSSALKTIKCPLSYFPTFLLSYYLCRKRRTVNWYISIIVYKEIYLQKPQPLHVSKLTPK